MTSLNSSNHSGIFWLIAKTLFSSSTKLELNFQYEGPLVSSSRKCYCRMVCSNSGLKCQCQLGPGKVHRSRSGVSSELITLWCCANVWCEKRLLICSAVLHSSGLNVSFPSSFLRIFIPLATCTRSAFFPLLTPSSNLFIKKVLTLSVMLVGRFATSFSTPSRLSQPSHS